MILNTFWLSTVHILAACRHGQKVFYRVYKKEMVMVFDSGGGNNTIAAD